LQRTSEGAYAGAKADVYARFFPRVLRPFVAPWATKIKLEMP